MKIKIYRKLFLSLFAALLFVLLTTCEKTPLNPYDEEAVELGFITALPEFSLEEGIYHKDLAVGLSCPDPDAVIYYTTDGSDPTTDSSIFTGDSVAVQGNGQIFIVKATAKNPDRDMSGIVASSYNIVYPELRIQVSGNGSVSPEITTTVQQDSPITISAFPETGYAFYDWSLTDQTTAVLADEYGQTTTVTLTGGDDVIVTARFETGVPLTVSNDGNGTTEPSGETLVVSGIPRAITAVPAEGYYFSGWTEVSSTGELSFTDPSSAHTRVVLSNGAAEIRADFEKINYQLTVSDDGYGTTDPSGAVTVEYGSSTAVSATAENGYQFLRWNIVSGSAELEDANLSSTTITLTSGDAEVRAEFVELNAALTLSDNGYGSTVPEGTVSVSQNVPFEISASSGVTGFGFGYWSVVSGSSVSFADEYSSATTVTLSEGDAEISAIFLAEYSLVISNDGNGTTSPEGSNTVLAGIGETITASPAVGYDFSEWTIVSGSPVIEDTSADSTNVTLSGDDAEIRADFVLKTYSLNLVNDGNGTTDPAGTDTVSHGVSTPIQAIPSAEYVFDYWAVNSGSGVSIADTGSASTTVVLTGGDAEIEAGFTKWPEITKFLPSVGGQNNYFGQYIGISGNYALISARENDAEENFTGVGYFYYFDGTEWTLQNKLFPDDLANSSIFISSVAVSGDYALVGSRQSTGAYLDSGSAYVFYNDGSGWSQQIRLIASDGAYSDNFGVSVSLDGNYALIGANEVDVDESLYAGAAYIYFYNGTTWTQQAKLTASEAETGDHFGSSVSISGDYAFIGVPNDDDHGSDSGSVYIFHNDGGWTFEDIIVSSDITAYGDTFGNSVSVDGNYAIIGACYDSRGAAYIFYNDGTSWTQQAKLIPSDPSDDNELFGFSVSISGDNAVVGAYGDDNNGGYSGAVYYYSRSGTEWIEQDKRIASDGTTGDYYGYSVSISGTLSAVGAYRDDDGGEYTGSAYILGQ